MNPAISCIEDTLRLLLEEAKQAKDTTAAKRGSPGEGFEVGRAEALAETLHTWANQLQTFGLDAQLNGGVARVPGQSRLPYLGRFAEDRAHWNQPGFVWRE
jgi:hypothetical protein